MGDVAMTVPILRALVKQHPDVKVTMISRPFFKAFFREIPNVSFFPVDLGKRHKGFLGLIRLFSDIKKLNIDAFADLHQVTRTRIVRTLFAIAGKKTSAFDKGRAERKALTRAENKIFKPLLTVFERHANVFAELGFPIDLSAPFFTPRQPLSANIFSLTGEKTQRWIGIAPFAQHKLKVYPLDLMEEVMDALASDQGNKIFLFGGGLAELTLLSELANGHENIIVAGGKMNFEEELNLISNLDLMLSMDSGNAHIAAIHGVKTVTLWGATHPFTGFYPYMQPIESAVLSDRNKFPKLPTSVYGNKNVEGYEDAMRTISPELVVEKVRSLLK
jgi:ADP-heptose:LPS heptosyltransferase